VKIYGHGTLRAPGTTRAVWDFAEDGIFDTVNMALIGEARRRGFWLGDEAIKQYDAEHAAPVEPPKEKAEPPKRKPGRPRKEAP